VAVLPVAHRALGNAGQFGNFAAVLAAGERPQLERFFAPLLGILGGFVGYGDLPQLPEVGAHGR
jgi:hypothetical protein